MSLVGDIIMDLRSRIPDAPNVLNVPLYGGTAFGAIVSNGAVPPGSYYIKVTVTNQWGETLPASQEINVGVILPSNGIVIQGLVLPSDASGTGLNTINAYIGTAPGAENSVFSQPITGNPATLTITNLGTPASPPTRPTAFLPDTDGNFIGAYTAYRLLNRALQEMVKIAGGIVDLTGVQSTVNQSMYRLASPFYTFTNAWFDGYPMDVVPRSFMYLRNSAAGFSGILSYEQDGPQSVIQVWPQSNRTGSQTVLTSPMSPSDSVAFLNNGRNFLSIGLAQIDQEIVAYSQVQNGIVMTGITRGLGGTDIVAHSAVAPVTELNIRLSGYRLAKNYVVGNAYQNILVPPAWETPLVLHMLYQVRSMEQDDATAEKLLSDFQGQADKIAKQSRLGRLKPRQIPIWGQNNSDARNINGIGFGWLIN